MLYEIMKSIRNFFPTRKYEANHFEIKDGTISLPFLAEGTYFMIEGSLKNDGVYKYPATLEDEAFTGVVTLLAPPKAFIELVDEIESYQANVTSNLSPYVSESFGGYTYTKATNSKGNVSSWQDAFSTRLNAWRKI